MVRQQRQLGNCMNILKSKPLCTVDEWILRYGNASVFTCKMGRENHPATQRLLQFRDGRYKSPVCRASNMAQWVKKTVAMPVA